MASKSLGTLTLDLVARVGGFEAGMDQASRKAKKSSDDIASAADEASSAWSKLTPIAAAVSAALGAFSLGGLLSSAIDEQEQLQRNMLRTEAVIRATGAAAGFTGEELHEQARQLALATLGSTEGIMHAQQVLLSYTNITGDAFIRTMELANDLSTLMGGSLVGATETLAKALDAPSQRLSSLTRIGFTFTEQQKEQIRVLEENGELLQAQQIILDTIAGSFGGLAREEAAGLAGAQDTLGQRIQEAKIELSQQLQLVDRASGFYNGLADTVLVVGKNMDAVIKAGEVIALVVGARVVAAVGAATASFVAGQLQALRYQAALARMAGVSATTAAGLTAMAGAARVANGALALVGGPAGAAILAASSLVYFATRASDAERESEALEARIGKLGDAFDRLSVNQAQAAIQDYETKLSAATFAMQTAEARVTTLTRNLSQFPNSKKAEEWARDLIAAEGAVDDAADSVNALSGKLQQLNKIVEAGGAKGLGANAQVASEAFETLNRQLDERLLLVGKTTDAEKLAARISAGFVEGLKRGEGDLLVAKQQQIDAEEASRQARERSAADAKRLSDAAVTRAAGEAKAIRSAVAELEQQARQLGWTSDQVALYELASRGATGADIARAAAAMTSIAVYKDQAEAAKAAADAQREINEEAQGIADSLLGEEEQILASYERRRQIILDNTKITGEAQAELLRELEEKKNEDLLEINGSYWERYLEAAEESLQSFDELAGSVVENFSSQFGSAFEAMVFDAQSLEDAVSGMAEGMARSVVNALGQMAAQWLAYQLVQMLVGKTTQSGAATAMASNAAAASIQAGINAFSSTAAIPIVGPAAAPAAMAAAIAATAPMAASVSALAMGGLAGMAHDGIDSVPQTGTWLLEKGERVTTAQTSARLDKTLSDIQSSRAASSDGRPINITVNQPGVTNAREARESSAAAARRIARAVQGAERYN